MKSNPREPFHIQAAPVSPFPPTLGGKGAGGVGRGLGGYPPTIQADSV